MPNWIVEITNKKSDVNKITLSCALAVQCARARLKTLLLDMDSDQADAIDWLTDGQLPEEELESGTVYSTQWERLDVCWITDPRTELPPVDVYDCVVVDGRPSGAVSGYILGACDLVLVPYIDEAGRKHGEKLASKTKHGAILIPNLAAGRPLPGRRAVVYDQALEDHRWELARMDLLYIVESVLEEQRRPPEEA